MHIWTPRSIKKYVKYDTACISNILLWQMAINWGPREQSQSLQHRPQVLLCLACTKVVGKAPYHHHRETTAASPCWWEHSSCIPECFSSLSRACCLCLWGLGECFSGICEKAFFSFQQQVPGSVGVEMADLQIYYENGQKEIRAVG